MKNKSLGAQLRALRTKKERAEKTPEQISEYYRQVALCRYAKKNKSKTAI